jgi:hypothetical protein
MISAKTALHMTSMMIKSASHAKRALNAARSRLINWIPDPFGTAATGSAPALAAISPPTDT